MKTKTMKITIKKRPGKRTGLGTGWTEGKVGPYRFQALVFPEHADNADWELGRSRISKLWLGYGNSTIFEWDRGLSKAAEMVVEHQAVNLLKDNLARLVFGAPKAGGKKRSVGKGHGPRGPKIPRSWPVQPLRPGQVARDKFTCGTCGLSWDDAKVTSMTPTPSGRCPFEAFHRYGGGKRRKAASKKPRRTRGGGGMKMPTTAVAWELYDRVGNEAAAKKLTAALKLGVKAVRKGTKPWDAWFHIIEPVADRLGFGATDTEPRTIAILYLENIAKMKPVGKLGGYQGRGGKRRRTAAKPSGTLGAVVADINRLVK